MFADGDREDVPRPLPRVHDSRTTWLRASDAERQATAERLAAAFGEGRLNLDEMEQRIAWVYASRYRSDLQLLVADLPAPDEGGHSGGWASVWQTVVRLVWSSMSRASRTPLREPTLRQQRITARLMVLSAIWVLACMLAGFALGLTS